VILNGRVCQLCNRKLGKDEKQHDFRLNTLDGIVEKKICNVCATFFDKSADVLWKNKPEEDWDVQDPAADV
jgi:hypothetical protein